MEETRIVTDKRHYPNIAGAIREKTGSAVMYTPEDMPDGITEVYEAGKNEATLKWWSDYTDDWTREYYRYAFTEGGWNDNTFNPPRVIKPKTDVRYMFQNAGMTSLDETQVDFSELTGPFRTTFSGMVSLKSLRLKFGNISGFYTDAFTNCTSLENLTILGTIAHTGFNVQWSTKLTHDSLMSIINALADKSGVGGTWEVTLGEPNIAKLTDAEKQIANDKGWQLG